MSNTYEITTLRDIFNLPTIEQMETCLSEMSFAMIQGRAANDLMLAAMKAVAEEGQCDDLVRVFEWPEPAQWVDDGKGEVVTRYGGPDGEDLFSIKNSPKP